MFKRLIYIANISVVLLIGLWVHAQQQGKTLSRTCDPALQKGLQACLTDLKLGEAVQDGALCIVLVDITDISSPRMAYVNPNRMMYAASLPKIAILLGAFERIEQGEMDLDKETLDTLKLMIRNSSNKAANEMLDCVGKDYISNLLQSPRYQFYEPDKNGGLWIGKEYGKAPAWKRDPLHNLSHGATALQVARFYYMLETGQLVSPEMSRLMKLILGDPAINHKFVKGLKKTHPDSRIYRKSGTWGQYHSDSGIIERNDRRYIAVALTKSAKGEKWLSELIVALDELICNSESASN